MNSMKLESNQLRTKEQKTIMLEILTHLRSNTIITSLYNFFFLLLFTISDLRLHTTKFQLG